MTGKFWPKRRENMVSKNKAKTVITADKNNS